MADYAEDHARVCNAIAMMIHEENPCFLLDFKDKDLASLMKRLGKEIKELRGGKKSNNDE